MTRLKMAGFENGLVTGVFDTQGGPISASTTQKRTGAYSLTNLGTYTFSWVLTTKPTKIYGRIGLYPFSMPAAASGWIVSLMDSGNLQQIGLKLNGTTGVLEARRWLTDSTWDILGSGGALAISSWYCIEFYAKIDAVNGAFEVKLDGVPIITFAGNTSPHGTAEVGVCTYCGSGISSVQYGVYGFYDDLAINDSLGTINDTWIGRGGIYMVKPEGAGTYTEHTPSAGNNWACVDEIPSTDDTDYVESAVADIRDTYAMTALVPAAGTISAVKWMARTRMAAPGTGNIRYLFRQSGVDYAGTEKTIDVSYRNVEQILELAPSGVPWTVAIVNAIEAGQKVV